MEPTQEMIRELMDSLADARRTLDACLSGLPSGDVTNRERVTNTIGRIDDARVKVLKELGFDRREEE
jgi:hypothetical protein